jgi:dynein light chain 1
MPGTTCAKAIQVWQEKNPDSPAEEAAKVALLCMTPPIEKMDSSLNGLVAVKHLSLSTNSIDKMISLPSLRNLEILSLGRNMIKKIAGLEEVGATLKELWLSYNLINTLDGLHSCLKLEILFMANNKLANWDELDKLTSLPELKNVLFIGNPMYEGLSKKDRKANVNKCLPTLATLDGSMLAAGTGDDEEEGGEGGD